MTIAAEILKTLVEAELAAVSDARVVAHIRGILVEPHVVLRSWDYGEPGPMPERSGWRCRLVCTENLHENRVGRSLKR
jgi:hypothetical protein